MKTANRLVFQIYNSPPPRRGARRVIIGCEQMAPLEQNIQAALNFTPISESGRQKLQEKIAPSRSAWENFLRIHEDSVTV
jgi:hypothetical protein